MQRLAAGHGFHLTGHRRFSSSENGFKVLWVEHGARNDIDAGIAMHDAAGWIEVGTYRISVCSAN